MAIRVEYLGCTVLSANGAREALDLLTEHGGDVDVLFTDVVMPGMSGPELADRVRELHPDIRVLFATGYTADMAVRSRLVTDEWDVLAKPYSVNDVATKLLATLRRGRQRKG